MKKVTVSLVCFLMLSTAVPAQALIIDGATLAAKISEWVGKVSDASTKLSQHVSQAKQLSSQGINKEALFGIGKDYFNEYASPWIKKNVKEIVKGTKQKNLEAMEAEKETYVTARNEYFDKKIEMTQKSIDDTTATRKEKESERNKVKSKMESAEQKYEEVKFVPGESEKAYDEYITLKMEYDALETACEELAALEDELLAQLSILESEKAKVGTDADPQYVTYQNRIDELKKEDEEDESSFVDKTEGNEELEWSMKNQDDIVDRFSPTEQDYTDFIGRYFYDPEELGVSGGDQGRLEHQTKIDAVARDRKYLLVNAAAHMLQVTASLRREVPVRTYMADELFANTPKSANELEAISSYSATRIENMRALLMYAKLQSARLQYMAARALLNAEGVKTPDGTYNEFNLEKYILTKEYVDEIVNEAEASNEAVAAAEEKDYKEENWEGYQWLEK